MQARKRISLLVLPVAIGMHGFAASAADVRAAPFAAVPVAATDAADATNATNALPAVSAQGSAAVAPAAQDNAFGVAMTAEQLDAHRGGDALIGQNDLTGTVANNTANRVVTGSNSISQGSFSNSSGLPTVIQNSGANVLIQNATVLNVRFGN